MRDKLPEALRLCENHFHRYSDFLSRTLILLICQLLSVIDPTTPMLRYFLHIGYQGKHYRGWQRQPDVVSVQETIETTLEKMLGKFTTCFGCGRTDAGVHASQYFLHIDMEEEWPFDPVFRLNKMLPDDIAVYDVLSMPETAHARYDAIARTYNYFIHRYKDPFLKDRSSLYDLHDFDVDKMRKAVEIIAANKDFKALCKQPDLYKHTLCDIKKVRLLEDKKGDHLRLEITADRFLRGMIRKIMARLVDIGRGQLSVDEFAETLHNRGTFTFKNNAYPQGLFLSKVVYPYLDLPTRTSL